MAAPLFHPEPLVVTLTIVSFRRDGSIIPPRTKKTHSRIVQPKGWKRPMLLPSKEYVDWEKGAMGPVKAALQDITDVLPIDFGVGCRALIYRDAERGDLCGYLQALGDFLQASEVMTNDRWIKSFDGSRLLKDAERPRIEVELTELR